MLPFLIPLATAGLPTIDEPLRTGLAAPGEAAVVVGIEDYLLLPDVNFARADAQAFASWLLHTRGLPADRVTVLTGGSRDEIRRAVVEARKQAGGGVVWVYFAGHGAGSPTDGGLLLIGDDARATSESLDSRGLRVAELAEIVGDGGPAVVVLDVCQSGTGRDGETLSDDRPAVPAEAIEARGGVVVLTATSPGQVAAPLAPAGHGAFTYFVVGGLRGWADGELSGAPDGVVDLAELSAYSKRMVQTVQSDQTPAVRVGQGFTWPAATPTAKLEPAPAVDCLAAMLRGEACDGGGSRIARRRGEEAGGGGGRTALAVLGGVSLAGGATALGFGYSAVDRMVDARADLDAAGAEQRARGASILLVSGWSGVALAGGLTLGALDVIPLQGGAGVRVGGRF